MSLSASPRSLGGLVPRYYLFRLTNTSGFFLPVAIIVLRDRGFGLGFVGLAYGVYALSKLVVEVPTGYVGDLLGRRASLALGSVVRALVVGVYPFVPTAELYLAVHVLWAVGRSFRSGTQDAWLYEVLQARYDETEFARIESRGSTLRLVVDAGTAVAGGVLYELAPASPFLGTAAIAILGVPVLLSFPRVSAIASDDGTERRETAERGEDGDEAGSGDEDGEGDEVDPDETTDTDELSAIGSSTGLPAAAAARLLSEQLRRSRVWRFVLFASVLYSVFVVTRIYEQPALDAVGVPVTGFGVLYAGFKLASAGAASTVGRVHDALGTRWVLAATVPVYGLAYGSILLAPSAVVPVLFLNRGLRTFTRPVIGQHLNELFPDVGRATTLSGASMAFAVVGGSARILAGVGVDRLGTLVFLPLAGVGLACLGGVLWLATTPVRSLDSGDTSDTAGTSGSDGASDTSEAGDTEGASDTSGTGEPRRSGRAGRTESIDG